MELQGPRGPGEVHAWAEHAGGGSLSASQRQQHSAVTPRHSSSTPAPQSLSSVHLDSQLAGSDMFVLVNTHYFASLVLSASLFDSVGKQHVCGSVMESIDECRGSGSSRTHSVLYMTQCARQIA